MLRAEEWAALQAAGRTDGAPVDVADGYVHFSTAEQLATTLARHFAGQDSLILLACEAEALASDLRWEPSRGGALFPHQHGELPVAAVVSDRSLSVSADGVMIVGATDA